MTDIGPITISVARRVRRGKEAEYEKWVKRVAAAAAAYPGFLGVNVLKPSKDTDGEYVLIAKFDSYEHQQAWEHSEERSDFHSQLGKLTEGEPKVSKVSGIEFWFSLPDVPVHSAPSQHKMALVLCIVVFVLVLLVNILFGKQLALLPLIPRIAILSVVQVLLLTYLIMPKVTGLLKKWLYKPNK